jgi:2-dehydropantoate 2-reductase
MNNISTTQITSAKIVIYGAGSIGCYLGGCLIAAQHSVTLIGRPRLQQQVGEYGLHITDYKSRSHNLSSEQVNYQQSYDELATADFILVTVKSGDTLDAAKAILSNATKQAVIISFQNGVSNPKILRDQLPGFAVLSGMVPFNVFNKGNGQFHCGTEGNLAIEDPNSVTGSLQKAFLSAQLPINIYDDLSGIQWSKLIMNLNNAVNALSGVPLLDQLNDPKYRQIMAQVIKEALFVLKIAEIKLVRTGKVVPALLPTILSLPTWAFSRVASAMLKIDPSARSSMYEDLQLKRKTEINYLNGEIVALALKLGLNAPVNSAIVNLVKEAENKKAGSPMMSAQILYDDLIHR